MRVYKDLEAELVQKNRWLADLNMALHVLKSNSYDKTSKQYAEYVHANYLKEINEHLKVPYTT